MVFKAQKKLENNNITKTLLYVTTEKYNNASGVWNKIISQCEALSKFNIDVFLLYWVDTGYALAKIQYNNFQVLEERNTEFFLKKFKNLKQKYYWHKYFYDFAIQIIKDIHPQILYFRHSIVIPKMLTFLYLTKKLGILTFLEIPTYPYRSELLGTKSYIALIMDIINFPILIRMFDYIIIITGCIVKSIDPSKVIYLSNGINISKYGKKKLRNKLFNDDSIHLLGVAKYNFWHGYDRLIEGLKNYYETGGKRKISLHFVGENMEKLMPLVKKYGLSENIKIYPPTFGKELDELYNHADIAVGSLGMYRKNLNSTSELKVREYFARGIPYIIACNDLDIPFKYPFQLIFNNEDRPIDVLAILSFFDNLSRNQEYIDEMRNFAEQKLDWSHKMHFVIDKWNEIESKKF